MGLPREGPVPGSASDDLAELEAVDAWRTAGGGLPSPSAMIANLLQQSPANLKMIVR